MHSRKVFFLSNNCYNDFMAEKDTTEKTLESYNDVFADIVNVLLFDGEQVVDENELEDAQSFSMYKDADDIKSQERDVSKYWKNGKIRIALYGFENQTKVDEFMPLRIIGYDGASYRSELNQKKIDEKTGKERALKREDLYPVVTLVLYFGNQRWNKSKNLCDCIDIPEKMKKFVSDYRINVFEVAYLPQEKIEMFQSDFRDVADFFVKQRTGERWTGSDKKMKHIYETLSLLSAVTKDDEFINLCRTKAIDKEEEVRMCDAVKRLKDEGRLEGKIEGKIEGRLEGRIELAKKLLVRGKYTIEEIAEDTELSLSEIEKLAKELKK